MSINKFLELFFFKISTLRKKQIITHINSPVYWYKMDHQVEIIIKIIIKITIIFYKT